MWRQISVAKINEVKTTNRENTSKIYFLKKLNTLYYLQIWLEIGNNILWKIKNGAITDVYEVLKILREYCVQDIDNKF